MIEFYEDGHLELYNLAEDISEKRDLSQDYKEKAAALYMELVDWRSSVNAQAPIPNAGFQSSEPL